MSDLQPFSLPGATLRLRAGCAAQPVVQHRREN